MASVRLRCDVVVYGDAESGRRHAACITRSAERGAAASAGGSAGAPTARAHRTSGACAPATFDLI